MDLIEPLAVVETTLGKAMKILTLLVASLGGFFSHAYAVWPEATYTEVRAYAYNLDGLSKRPAIIVDGKLHPTVVNSSGAVLTKKQETRLLAALNGEATAHPVANCFIPRHAFVFFRKNEIVASVDVCFQCLAAESTPEGMSHPSDLATFAELCAELKLPQSPEPGFRKWLEELSKPKKVKESPN